MTEDLKRIAASLSDAAKDVLINTVSEMTVGARVRNDTGAIWELYRAGLLENKPVDKGGRLGEEARLTSFGSNVQKLNLDSSDIH